MQTERKKTKKECKIALVKMSTKQTPCGPFGAEGQIRTDVETSLCGFKARRTRPLCDFRV